jgi:hypothetical protein
MLILITLLEFGSDFSSLSFPFALDKVCTEMSHYESILVDAMLRLFITFIVVNYFNSSTYNYLEAYENLYPADHPSELA